MKITYNKNPLYTTIHLDENEKKELWYKIKIAEMEELLSSADFYLNESKYFDLEKAREELDTDYYSTNNNEKSNLDTRCDMLLDYYLKSLDSFHVGDCTCVACSCSKCHAESILGIDTIPGVGKHTLYKINNAFGKDNSKTIEEAISSLEKFEINPQNYQTENWKKIGGYEQYVPRWEAENKVAYEWLIQYKQRHFNNN